MLSFALSMLELCINASICIVDIVNIVPIGSFDDTFWVLHYILSM
jgi:hypothetical protein